MHHFMTLKHDSVFKNVFFRDYRLLKQVLITIFKICGISTNINYLSIKNCELTKNRLYIKNKIVDILIENDDKVINFEVNTKWDKATKNRNLLYFSSLIGSPIKRKQSYRNLKEFIQININHNNKSKNSICVYELYDKNNDKIFTNKFKIIEINIDKIIDEWYNSSNKEKYYQENKFLLVMGMNKEKLNNMKEGDDKYMDKIKNDVFMINEDEEFYQVITDEEDEEKWRMTYYEDGEAKGIKKEKKETAKNMKKEGLSLDIIKKITGLDINTIKSL